jgi:hypothetical protein
LSTSSATAAAPSGSENVARAFGSAYARYLDDELAVDRLPSLTSVARGQAGPPLPLRTRAGTTRVVNVRELGDGAQYVLDLRDHAHTFSVQVSVQRVGARDVIDTVVPPDIDSIVHSTGHAAAPPRGSAAAEAAARRFLAGYLPWLYGHGELARIRNASRSLRAFLRAHVPVIPPTSTGLHGRVAAVGMRRSKSGWTALVNVTDGQETYQIDLSLVQMHQRWLATKVRTVA